jgi:hypothetical protein
MNKTQINHFNMFLNTQGFMDDNTTKWNSIARLTEIKNDFDEIITRISAKSQDAVTMMGVTGKKEALRSQIGLKISAVSGVLQAFAYDKGDTDLAGKVKATKSDIERMREQDINGFVRAIISIAQENIQELAGFGINESNLTETLTSLEEFNALIGKPRSILNKKYATLDTIEKLFDEGNALLNNKLDNIMLIFRESDPEFYNGYERARVIVNK